MKKIWNRLMSMLSSEAPAPEMSFSTNPRTADGLALAKAQIIAGNEEDARERFEGTSRLSPEIKPTRQQMAARYSRLASEDFPRKPLPASAPYGRSL